MCPGLHCRSGRAPVELLTSSFSTFPTLNHLCGGTSWQENLCWLVFAVDFVTGWVSPLDSVSWRPSLEEYD